MTLSSNQLNDICLLNSDDSSKTCRYLKNDELERDKWYCQKLNVLTKSKIDKNIRHLSFKGDNCSGYPLLKHITQGYDVTS